MSSSTKWARRAPNPVRVGLFGKFGSGNIGNDASMEAVLNFLRSEQPDARVDVMCTGPRVVRSTYRVDAVPIHEDRNDVPPSTLSTARKILRLLRDMARAIWWVGHHDVVIIPGTGVLETSLPVVPRAFPFSMFLIFAACRVFGVRTALVAVGAGKVSQRRTRWLYDSVVRLSTYRSYRDVGARESLRERGLDVTNDHVYPDLAFSLPTPCTGPGDERSVAVGVMAYHGSEDERQEGDAIYASYVAEMKCFIRWLVDSGYRVRLIVGDTNGSDDAVAVEVMEDLRSSRPDADASQVAHETVTSFTDLAQVMSKAATVVAIRYHSVLCALKLGRPVLAIGYSAKHDALMEDMGMAEFCQPVASLEAGALADQFLDLERRSEELRQVLGQRNAEKNRLLADQFAELSEVVFPVGQAALRSEVPVRVLAGTGLPLAATPRNPVPVGVRRGTRR